MIEVRCWLDGYAAYLGARALEKAFGIGEQLVEVPPDRARKDSNGDDGRVAAPGHTERHHEGVRVLVDELIRAGDSAAYFAQAPLNQ